MATTVKMHFEPRSAHLYQNYIFKRCFLDVIVEREKTFPGGANSPKCFLASEMAKNGIARQKHPISRRFLSILTVITWGLSLNLYTILCGVLRTTRNQVF